ncbi:MAG: family 10 glycosylhydrolase [Planctomycetota bacterium]
MDQPLRLPRVARRTPTLLLVGVVSLTGSFAAAVATAADPFGESRGLWISRFEYDPNVTSSITQKFADAATLGITDVYWQVRGKSDRYYDSTAGLETAAENWNGSIDPLQTAIDAADQYGIKVHAWLNTMPIWRDTSQPSDPNHIWYNENPSFRVTDIDGNVESLPGGSSSFSGSYARVNHTLPAVQAHIMGVASDIAMNYDVAGIHLDYVRWLGPSVSDGGVSRPDWDYLPHDPVTYARYEQETGNTAGLGGSFSQRQAYRDWVSDKVTELVTGVKAVVDAVEVVKSTELELSAAVWNNPTRAANEYLQDYRTWIEQELLDVAIPMVYLRNSNNFLLDGFLDDIFDYAGPSQTEISIGLGTYLHTPSEGGVNETIDQIQRVYNDGRADNLTFFSWGSLFNGSLSQQRAAAVNSWYASLNDTQPPAQGNLAEGSTVITGFDLPGDEGFFDQPITAGGQTTISTASFADQTSLDSHIGDGSQLLSIVAEDGDPWTLRHLSGAGATPQNNLPIDATGNVGFWLKTETEGLTVQIAVDDPVSADRGVLKNVIADGEWRLYEWSLDDDSQWIGWVNGDGEIVGPQLTLDSIFLYGTGDAEVYLDTVAHNPGGSLLAPTPGDADGDGLVDEDDYVMWANDLGATGPGLAADLNGDEVVDLADYTLWRDNFDPSATPVPEPSTALLIFALGVAISRRAPRERDPASVRRQACPHNVHATARFARTLGALCPKCAEMRFARYW